MGVLNNLEPHTQDLLDAIDDDDIMIYLYKNKLISHQVVKKYFNIKDICELPDMSYWTKIDLEDDLGISDDDILNEMWDDDIYQYLEDHGYDFPEPEEPEDPELWWDNADFIETVKSAFNRRFGKTWTKEDLKKQINEAIDWFGMDAQGET